MNKEKEVLFSIVMPYYKNSGQEVSRAIQSVKDQSINNWELICVNDGGLPLPMEESDPRIKNISITHQGRSVARNVGIENAAGQFICFLDADDTLESDYIEKYHSIVQASDYSNEVMVQSMILYDAKRATRKLISWNGISTASDVQLILEGALGIAFCAPRVLFNQARFAPYLALSEDKHLLIRLSCYTKFKRIPDGAYCYHVPERNPTKEKLAQELDTYRFAIIDAFEKSTCGAGDYDKKVLQEALQFADLRAVGQWLSFGDVTMAKQIISEIDKHKLSWKNTLRYYKRYLKSIKAEYIS